MGLESMPVKVSVVIPVYNPGKYIEDCVSSLLRQSLPPDEFEAIFVDDGSTDETPARLDRLAAEYPHLRVIHQEPSGWSGKPRNVGTAAARGEYVMYCDNDDWLGDEALERMYNYGVENGADVVIGKMAGKGRPVPLELFRRNRPRANVENAPLIDSLTPHKMFRKAFMEQHNMLWPEGRRRLEDHVFVTRAYLLAGNISVLSDYVCYYHVKREDASNAGFQRFDPVGYFKNLREALDIVEEHTEPGPLRDRLFRRWLRNEMVERMRGQRLLRLPHDYRKELFDEMHTVVVERFGPGVTTGLMPTQQIVAGLIAADRLGDVEEFAKWEAGIKPTGALETVDWQDGKLRLGFTAQYLSGGEPVTFRTDAESGKDLLAPPLPTTSLDAIALLGLDTSAPLAKSKVDLVVRERETAAEFFQPVEIDRQKVPVGGEGPDPGVFRQVLHASAEIDPQTAANGKPLPAGIWDVLIRISSCGWTKETRLGSVRDERARAGRAAGVVGSPERLVLPYWTDPHGNLSLDVDQTTGRLVYEVAAVTDEKVAIDSNPARFNAALPLHVRTKCEASLKLTDPAGHRTVALTASLEAAGEGENGAVLGADLPLDELADGKWRVEFALSSPAGKQRFIALPVVLEVPADASGAVVRPGIQAAADLAAKGPERPKKPVPSQAPQKSVLRRAAGKVRRALTK
jgi:poly(ribitol-phosphate) beta-N-acetylglucosaminyltransferase